MCDAGKFLAFNFVFPARVKSTRTAQKRAMTGQFKRRDTNTQVHDYVYILNVQIQTDWLGEQRVPRFLGRDDPRCSGVCRMYPGPVACGCSGVSSPGNCLGSLVWWDPSSRSPTPSPLELSLSVLLDTTIVPCPAMRTMGAISCGSPRIRAESPALHLHRHPRCTRRLTQSQPQLQPLPCTSRLC